MTVHGTFLPRNGGECNGQKQKSQHEGVQGRGEKFGEMSETQSKTASNEPRAVGRDRDWVGDRTRASVESNKKAQSVTNRSHRNQKAGREYETTDVREQKNFDR